MPMAIVMMPAMSAVAAAYATASFGPMGSFAAPIPPSKMLPFKKMMYAITMNVVTPARVSVMMFVPRSSNLK